MAVVKAGSEHKPSLTVHSSETVEGIHMWEVHRGVSWLATVWFDANGSMSIHDGGLWPDDKRAVNRWYGEYLKWIANENMKGRTA